MLLSWNDGKTGQSIPDFVTRITTLGADFEPSTKRIAIFDNDGTLHYLRSKAGAEVDFIIARGGRLIPIEVKWTEHPTPGDARHLLTFLDEHPKRARHGYVICRCPTPLALTDRVTALPWSHL